MTNVRIEEVGDINSHFPYLEVFLQEKVNPIMEIGITDNRSLYFKHYELDEGYSLSV